MVIRRSCCCELICTCPCTPKPNISIDVEGVTGACLNMEDDFGYMAGFDHDLSWSNFNNSYADAEFFGNVCNFWWSQNPTTTGYSNVTCTTYDSTDGSCSGYATNVSLGVNFRIVCRMHFKYSRDKTYLDMSKEWMIVGWTGMCSGEFPTNPTTPEQRKKDAGQVIFFFLGFYDGDICNDTIEIANTLEQADAGVFIDGLRTKGCSSGGATQEYGMIAGYDGTVTLGSTC